LLAYLFFHRPAAGVDRRVYEDGLREFHAALAGAHPALYTGSASYRIGDGYCDWYTVESSAALDTLNEVAVSGPRSASHRAVAQRAVDAAGKLMSLVAGRPSSAGKYEIRFSKPKGMDYPELYARLKPVVEREGVSLWRRMMTLGPPPEFVLLSPERLELPSEMSPEVISREQV